MQNIISSQDRLRVIEDVAITILLDESSSMKHVQDVTRDSVNKYVADLQTDAAPVTMSLATFASVVKWRVNETPTDSIQPLEYNQYRPAGSTSLYDAIGQAIRREEARDIPAVHPIIVVFTDGMDVGSREYTAEQLKPMIAERRKRGWQFIACVVGNAAADATETVGFLPADTYKYSGDGASTQQAFAMLTASTKRLATAVLKALPPPANFLA